MVLRGKSGILVAAVAGAAVILAVGCGEPPTPATEVSVQPPRESSENPPGQTSGRWEISVSGLQIREMAPGFGRPVQTGDLVKVHYTGWLLVNGVRGTEFDSSRDGDPIVFTVGAGQVIAGWDQGLVGMHEGSQRELIIPPELGYGSRGYPGAIPPGATLNFEVELVEIVSR